MPPKDMSGAVAPPSTPAARIRFPPAGSPEAPILVPSEASSDADVSELLRELRGLLLEFRRVITSVEAMGCIPATP
ncbi:hypothetical protein DTO166G4_1597 [Paecilomyces variotii]|nr:hypothetical protein DTO032I3_7399 [Paecilomyces variotii]KAJ9198103.1 hypothetical protein DTO164E3_5359 [Paecilomyces variotii]KAJ9216751.1 hypothetical protein DTO166G4_1597 [Paecilomyces variotii]KAJ9222408.1 hypothetical protein DTO169C6_5343 [Paecilomyces variotii]KAJ9229688.1 hypothetical protein DTO169E5_8762 [Paecilomyces variotii]